MSKRGFLMIKEDDVFRTEVAKKLIKLREERDLSKKGVAKATGISYDLYRYYETSVIPPSANLIKLAKFFNVPLDYFTDRAEDTSNDDPFSAGSESAGNGLTLNNYDGFQIVDDDPGKLTEEEILFLQTFRSLSEEDKIELARYLKNKRDK